MPADPLPYNPAHGDHWSERIMNGRVSYRHIVRIEKRCPAVWIRNRRSRYTLAEAPHSRLARECYGYKRWPIGRRNRHAG